MTHRDAVGSDAGGPHLRHGAFYSGVASLRPVDATGHEKDVMRGEECGMKREAGNGLQCYDRHAVLKSLRLLAAAV
jgi:hypothetical protein